MENLIPDISHHNGKINWLKLAATTPFVIFKGTQRNDFVSPTLDLYIQKAEETKVPYWIYAYLEKGNEKTQAEFLVKTCKSLIGSYFIGYVIDAEEGNTYSDILKALEVVKAAAGKAMFYGEYKIWKKLAKAGKTADVIFWEARYGLNSGVYNSLFPPHKTCALHQYTDKGLTTFIQGEVDLNRLTGIVPLEWFTTPKNPDAKIFKITYTGDIPVFPKRKYYKLNDGIRTYTDYIPEIKKVQKILNWLLDGTLVIDGKYGKKTRAAVELAQAFLGVKIDGYFGQETLTAALKCEKTEVVPM